MKDSTKHHYVPEWYQRRFLFDNQTAYYRLDLDPEVITTPSGKKIKKSEINHKGPSKFFYVDDLYTTDFFGKQNDDIEKYLFGKIDTIGADAIKAMVSPNWMSELHPHFINFFEYMDAQKLRTPKGLTWITKVIKVRNYNALLLKMQSIRKMNCTMWVEAVMEIVSAEDSEIKFIVSDNPVTLYNPKFSPSDKRCAFPFDPGIELKGTRTIFPLDKNNCTVLTNLEYAQSPNQSDADKKRTNPRFFDSTIARYDTIIRNRKLNEFQVSSINYILKSRAHKFIASPNKEWLFPEEKINNSHWDSFDEIFNSDEFSHLGFGGQIFIGGSDGRLIATQDDFGRKPKNKREWEEKEKQAKALQAQALKLLKKHKKEI